MQLSKEIISKINADIVEVPSQGYFDLPEKVLQFGTGVLLRGLPDYFIDKANKHKKFNGRIVMIKSTDTGGSEAFDRQDCLYTLCVRGIEDGKIVEKNIVNASISRLISAKNDWQEVLKCAANENMQVVISNTTEVGLTLMKDNVHASPPESFPGKLLSFLYERYKIFNGDPLKGLVIIPTELIPQNADKLLSILLELANQNELEMGFSDWLKNSNYFCNSLVDRIVPGKLNVKQQQEMELKAGFQDELMIMSEAYRLWAIESSNERVKEILSFADADAKVFIGPDIAVFRELKLRLLNGSHTFSCGLAHLAGFTTVKEAMSDQSFSEYIKDLMFVEIAHAITEDNLTYDLATDFAGKVLDRYSNPYIEHQWLSITMQYTSKMYMRNVTTLKKYFERTKEIPVHMAIGFAGYLLFMRPVEITGNKYYGEVNGQRYFINDDNASYFYEMWQKYDINDLVNNVLGNKTLWRTDLSAITGFGEAVKNNLTLLLNQGARKTIKNSIQNKKISANDR